jgi:hypothetical protein
MSGSNIAYYLLAISGAAIGSYFVAQALKRARGETEPKNTKARRTATAVIPETLTETKGKVIEIEPIEILGKVEPAPAYTVGFDVEIGTLEKLAVDESDIKSAVLKYASRVIGDLVGNPTVITTETSNGYRVVLGAKTYDEVPGPSQIKTRIEAIDSRLQGRISNVKVNR